MRGTATAQILDIARWHRGATLAQAAYQVVVEELPPLGGDGGVIALDARGRLSTPHSSEGLLHGWITSDGDVVTRVFADEDPRDGDS